MGKAKPLQIGIIEFETQGEAREFIREILDAATWGVPLQGDVREFVLNLLDRHPRATEKIGCGISCVTVDGDGNGDRCFYVHRTDGSKHHFSYQKSLMGKDNARSYGLGCAKPCSRRTNLGVPRLSTRKRHTDLPVYRGNYHQRELPCRSS
jgi:Protein of unknown function (DUF3223)